MANGQLQIDLSPQSVQWLKDTEKALQVLADQNEINRELRNVHAPYTTTGSKDLRSIAVYNPGTERYKRTGRQPYGHIKANIKSTTLRRNKNGKAVTIDMDAFHYNFIEYGTRERVRKDGRSTGRIKGRYAAPSSGTWNRTEFVKSWAERRVAGFIEKVPEDYYIKIFRPNQELVRKKYWIGLKYILPPLK